jgi:hypothetical protein
MEIYPWYEEEDWFNDLFHGDTDKAHQFLKNYNISPPAQAYFRTSYASLRVNGFEYARLNPNGRLTVGQQNKQLNLTTTKPSELVTALAEMFNILSQNHKDITKIAQWAKCNFDSQLADFLEYAAINHQPEHWLESKILENPNVLPIYDSQIRSQIVAHQVGLSPKGRKCATSAQSGTVRCVA